MQPQLLSSKSEHWCTADSFLNLVRQIDSIGLDPCSNLYSRVNAKKTFTLPDYNGLAESWQGEGLVFVNPPYGRKIPAWCRKMASEASQGVEIIALLPARTGTRWFHEIILPSHTCVAFLKGRQTFVDGTTGRVGHSATFDSMVVYWGEQYTDKFIEVFSPLGLVVKNC